MLGNKKRRRKQEKERWRRNSGQEEDVGGKAMTLRGRKNEVKWREVGVKSGIRRMGKGVG